ncbi:unnamed protein product, partial [Staurois parvus]
MIPYCPGAPGVVSPPLNESKRKSQILGCHQNRNRGVPSLYRNFLSL